MLRNGRGEVATSLLDFEFVEEVDAEILQDKEINSVEKDIGEKAESTHDLIAVAFRAIFPRKDIPLTSLVYNRRFTRFNANIRVGGRGIEIGMHEEWRDIDDSIKLGLIEHLLRKVYRRVEMTPSVLLYKNFVKTISSFAVVEEQDVVLKASFDRNNILFFEGGLECPNLKWGQESTRRLAHYNFQSHTIVMSTAFCSAPAEMLDFIMYHEMLHIVHKFHVRGVRDVSHSAAFRADERKFPRFEMLEKEIERYVRTVKNGKKKGSWWKFF